MGRIGGDLLHKRLRLFIGRKPVILRVNSQLPSGALKAFLQGVSIPAIHDKDCCPALTQYAKQVGRERLPLVAVLENDPECRRVLGDQVRRGGRR